MLAENKILKLIDDIVNSYREYDDPNGPFRCSYCDAPSGKWQSDCIKTQAWALYKDDDNLLEAATEIIADIEKRNE